MGGIISNLWRKKPSFTEVKWLVHRSRVTKTLAGIQITLIKELMQCNQESWINSRIKLLICLSKCVSWISLCLSSWSVLRLIPIYKELENYRKICLIYILIKEIKPIITRVELLNTQANIVPRDRTKWFLWGQTRLGFLEVVTFQVGEKNGIWRTIIFI